MDKELRVLSIDAWREPEGGWTWNASYDAGYRIPKDLVDKWEEADFGLPYPSLPQLPRKLFKHLREVGALTEHSKGRVSVEDCGYFLTIKERSTDKPLFAVELAPC